MNYILSIDQGTTGSTAALINTETLELYAKANTEFNQIFPNSGEVEHNLEDIWSSVKQSISKVFKKASIIPNQISGIGITNQRETTCAFKKDGTPLANAIVWQDRRTANWCQENQDKQSFIRKKTGLPLDSYFSGSKIKWLLENNPEVQKAKQENNLYFGTIDTFLIFKLTAGNSFATDTTNASRTLLMDLKSLKWDPELLNFFGVDIKCLPTIQDSCSNFGVTKGHDFLPDGILIGGVLGDQQAALYGQACFEAGEMKCTYGTGAFLLANTGEEIVYSSSGLLSTVAFSENGKACYALEGSSFIAGAAVQWLRDNLRFFDDAAKIESFASKANRERCKELLFLPFFSGIGSPYWVANAKAAIIGMDRGCNQNEISLACLEGISLGVNDIIESIQKDLGRKLQNLKVDGGAVKNGLLMQIQSNFSNLEIQRPEVIETTAYGAALACIKQTMGLKNSDIIKKWNLNQTWEPSKKLDYYKEKKELYLSYIERNFI